MRNWQWKIDDADSSDMLVSNCPELRACIWQDEQKPIGAQFRISVYWQGESNLLAERASAGSIWRALEIAEAICERTLDTIPTSYAPACGASEF